MDALKHRLQLTVNNTALFKPFSWVWNWKQPAQWYIFFLWLRIHRLRTRNAVAYWPQKSLGHVIAPRVCIVKPKKFSLLQTVWSSTKLDQNVQFQPLSVPAPEHGHGEGVSRRQRDHQHPHVHPLGSGRWQLAGLQSWQSWNSGLHDGRRLEAGDTLWVSLYHTFLSWMYLKFIGNTYLILKLISYKYLILKY